MHFKGKKINFQYNTKFPLEGLGLLYASDKSNLFDQCSQADFF